MFRTLPIALLVVCCSIGFADDPPKGITVDKDKRTVTIDAKMAPRKLEDPKFQGNQWPIEVIACWSYEKKGHKAHETVVTMDDVKPSDVHKAIESLGIKPGKPVVGDDSLKTPPQGPAFKVYLEFAGPDDQPKRVPIEKCLVGPGGKPMPVLEWRFTGSVMSKPDPTKEDTVYGADLTGTLISIFPVTNETVFQTNLTMKEEKFLKIETDPKVVPKVGAAVKIVLEATGK
jgi:hypothetical protein